MSEMLDPSDPFPEQEAVLLEGEDEEAFNRIISELEARPHLAFPVAQWMIPQLTFAPASAVTGSGAQRFVGVIHFQHSQKGYSFIRSKEATEAFGMDVFLHTAQKGDFQLNDQVCFAVLLNKDGKPQAFDLNRPTETDMLRWGHAEDSVNAIQAWTPATTWTDPEFEKVSSEVTSPAEGRHIGQISAFKPEMYGFIKCAELFAQTNQDVWVHHKQMQGFKVGDTVTFSVTTNKNGQLQAQDLRPATAQVVPARWQQDETPKSGPPKIAAKSMPAKQPPKQVDMKQVPKQVPPRLGYGAAKSKPAGDPPAIGQGSQGQLPIGARKRPSQNHGAASTAADPKSLEGTRQWGTISAWRPGGKYGFLKCDETFAAFQKDCWVHYQQLDGFHEGDTVSFTVVLNKDGHPQAIDLRSEGNKRYRY